MEIYNYENHIKDSHDFQNFLLSFDNYEVVFQQPDHNYIPFLYWTNQKKSTDKGGVRDLFQNLTFFLSSVATKYSIQTDSILSPLIHMSFLRGHTPHTYFSIQNYTMQLNRDLR